MGKHLGVHGDVAEQSIFRTAARTRYPGATIIGDGPWGVVLDQGKVVVVDLYPTRAQAAWNGDVWIEFFGREFVHKMDTEKD